MSEDREPYGELDGNSYAIAEIERLPRSLSRDGCVVSATGLTISQDMPWSSYGRLVRYMDNLAYAHSVRDCLFKFYVGDALNQGEDIYGERFSQIFDRLHWAHGYLSNVQWVCRNVPDENRDIKINNWKFWCLIAPLDTDEQRQWVAEAHEEISIGDDWYQRLKERLDAWKLSKEIDGIDDEEQRKEVAEVAGHNANVSWTHVRHWKRSGKIPEKQKTAVEWWMDKLDEHGVEGDEREKWFAVAMEFVTECRKRNIKPEGVQKIWKV